MLGGFRFWSDCKKKNYESCDFSHSKMKPYTISAMATINGSHNDEIIL